MTTTQLILNNAGFGFAKTLVVGGVPTQNASHFNVNIGHNDNDVALYVDVRFSYKGHVNKVVCNSRQGGVWGQEVVANNFPFKQGEKFQMTIQFTSAGFQVILPDDSTIPFPNRLGNDQYSVITVNDDVRIKSIEIQ